MSDLPPSTRHPSRLRKLVVGAVAFIGVFTGGVEIYDRFFRHIEPPASTPCYVGTWQLTSETTDKSSTEVKEQWLYVSGRFIVYYDNAGGGRITLADFRRKHLGTGSAGRPLEEYVENGSLNFRYEVRGQEIHYTFAPSETYTLVEYVDGVETQTTQHPATEFSAVDSFACSANDFLLLYQVFKVQDVSIKYEQSFKRI